MIRGVCDKARLLDLVENFTLFDERKGELAKLVAKNHQFLGVNNAHRTPSKQIKENQGKLGVFWHTQGRGKSFRWSSSRRRCCGSCPATGRS